MVLSVTETTGESSSVVPGVRKVTFLTWIIATAAQPFLMILSLGEQFGLIQIILNVQGAEYLKDT